MATKSIGYVADLIGDAQVRGVDGIIRVLSIGDQINEGDILTTGVNTDIVLEFHNGQKLQLGENTEMLLDESVFASLNAYPDARADQLAELQSLIVEGIDLAELEATAAGPAGDSGDALHSASIYSRDGNEGIVETQGTPLGFDASAANDQPALGDDDLLIASQSSSPTTPPAAGPAPIASISVDNITADDVVNGVESGAAVNVTGSVGGDASSGDSVSLDINGNSYSGTVGAGNTFSIPVSGSDLAADTTLVASVSGTDAGGTPFSANTTSTHGVDSSASASINVDPITADDIVNAAEAGATINVSGSVGGDASTGDSVSFDIN
ncbi:MAG: retention module-containing protein, partial [Gammaproteobacteria bacterium]|nr:retention module-containing protein [Gammaproteobacteria bacterium]